MFLTKFVVPILELSLISLIVLTTRAAKYYFFSAKIIFRLKNGQKLTFKPFVGEKKFSPTTPQNMTQTHLDVRISTKFYKSKVQMSDLENLGAIPRRAASPGWLRGVE